MHIINNNKKKSKCTDQILLVTGHAEKISMDHFNPTSIPSHSPLAFTGINIKTDFRLRKCQLCLNVYRLKVDYLHTHTHNMHHLETQRPHVPADLLLISHVIQPQVQFSVFKRDTALEIISSSNTMRHTQGKKNPLAL